MHTLLLARALVGGGHRVVVCAYYEHNPIMVGMIESTGAEVRLLNLKRHGALQNLGRMPALAIALGKVIREVRPNFVHVQYMAPGVVPVVVARLMGVPRVLATVHVPARHYRRVWMPRSVARLCDAFLCVSQTAERSFFGDSALFDEPLLRRGRKHFAIPNCVDLEQVDAIEQGGPFDALRQSLGLEGKKIVGMVSRLSPEKGPQYLIEAFAAVARRVSDAALLIVGDGTMRPELERRARELSIGNRIVWAGRVPQAEAFRHLAIMDVVVAPSMWEGFGLSAAEAMAFGKPVVVSDVDGLSEVVADGETGLLVPPGNADALAEGIVTLLDDESMRDRMGRAGRARVGRQFSFRAFSEAHSQLYTALCASPRDLEPFSKGDRMSLEPGTVR